MARVQTFRYPQRTRTRALEIFHKAEGGCRVRQIVEMLEREGHGLVARNTVERWLREDPGRRAMQTTAVAKRLRREAAAVNGTQESVDRIASSANELADIVTITMKRAAKYATDIPLETTADLAYFASTCRDLITAALECSLAVHELRARDEANSLREG